MSEGIQPTRAKYDAMADAAANWAAKQRVAGLTGQANVISQKEADVSAKLAAHQRQAAEQEERLAFNTADERDKSPIEAALDNLHYATHLLESCIGELSRRLEPVSLPCTPIVGNERKPANSPMEEVILDRCDEVIAAHDRIRGIIERLQL